MTSPPYEQTDSELSAHRRRGVGFLLVGHGTRQVAGQQQMRQVFSDFANLLSPFPAELAFLELAEPDIETAIQRLAGQGVSKLITVPVLLFTAGHAVRDIPEAVEAACEKLEIESIGQTPSLQLCEPMLELSALRFRETLCSGRMCGTPTDAGQQPASNSEREPQSENREMQSDKRVTECVDACGGHWCSRAGLLMVGRGSNSDEATQAMRQFTAERLILTPAAWSQTCFIHGQSPTVEQGLDQLAASGQPLAVVQPHLLFEGELIATLRQQVAELAERHPHQRWLITGTLGTDARLGRTLAEVALQTLGSPLPLPPLAPAAQ